MSRLLCFEVTTGEYSVVDDLPCPWRCQDMALGNVDGALCVVVTLKSLLVTVWLRTGRSVDAGSPWQLVRETGERRRGPARGERRDRCLAS